MGGIQGFIYHSPIGNMEVEITEIGISSLIFTDKKEMIENPPIIITECFKQLDEYFFGTRKIFDLNLDLIGTEFQIKVWEKLVEIPYGSTISYLSIANKLGNPKSIRAVGSANGSNPISIIVPCHRVIGLDGNLTGYAGGLWRKKWLIEHEAQLKQLSLF